MKRQTVAKRKGIFLAETLMGTMLAMTVFTIVIIAISGQSRLARKMAARRDSIHDVEASLLAIQTNQKPQSNIQVRTLPTTAPTGWQWATVSSDGFTLVGVVPDQYGKVQP